MTTYYTAQSCDLSEFQSLCAQSLAPEDVPHAHEIAQNVPIYDVAQCDLITPQGRSNLLAEWATNIGQGSGIVVLRGAYADTQPIDAATAVFEQIIQDEADHAAADHFSAAGNNARIWNSLQKLCLRAPDVFALYFGNTSIAAISEAWLGPNYQMTSQVNLVRPGGAAQQAHRDYHLGFQTDDVSSTYPSHVHALSPALTLQGAVAHTDMPVESGPTKLLPFSQAYLAGYAAWRRPDFRDYFEANCIQLPLAKGDALFFSPALFHAAGANESADVQRMANLLQVSSAFGRAMETIDRVAMCKAMYPAMQVSDMSSADQAAAIAACAEGYSFPTNLDRDPPVGGLAPQTQAALFRQAIAEDWPRERFYSALEAQNDRQRA